MLVIPQRQKKKVKLQTFVIPKLLDDKNIISQCRCLEMI